MAESEEVVNIEALINAISCASLAISAVVLLALLYRERFWPWE